MNDGCCRRPQLPVGRTASSPARSAAMKNTANAKVRLRETWDRSTSKSRRLIRVERRQHAPPSGRGEPSKIAPGSDIAVHRRSRDKRLTPPLRQVIFWVGRYDLLLAPPEGTVNVSEPFSTLCPNERVSNASPGTPVSLKQRIKICATSATPKPWRTPCGRLSPQRVSRLP